MGDLPDWVTATNNLSAQLVGGLILPGAQLDQDVSPNDSLIINAFGVGSFGLIALKLEWYTNFITGFFVVAEYFTAIADPAATAQFIAETPVYATFLRLTNMSAIDVDFTVTGSSRTVAQPKLLDTCGPGRIFQYTGAMTGGTGVTLLAIDGGGSTFASNAMSTFFCQASVAGQMDVFYVDRSGVVRGYPVANLAANVGQNVTLAVPQGMVLFSFTPTGSAGGASATVIASPAQL